MEYCRSLKFDEEPNYAYAAGLFDACMQRNNYNPNSLDYTWKMDRFNQDLDGKNGSKLDAILKQKQQEFNTTRGKGFMATAKQMFSSKMA